MNKDTMDETTKIELLYVWIKEFKNIKEQGFNFGGEYLFDYGIE